MIVLIVGLFLLAVAGASLIIAFNTRRLYQAVLLENAKILSQKKSSEVRTGQIAEQLAPFLKEFKYNPKRTHFIGMPIDFIVFEDDKVIFLEIKSGKAQLSDTQKNIKRLVQQNKVQWDEMRIDGKNNDTTNDSERPDTITLVSGPPTLQSNEETEREVLHVPEPIRDTNVNTRAATGDN